MTKTEKETKILPAKPTLFEMFDYLCSRVNWGKASLDNEAICCMNTLFTELRKQTEMFDI